MSDTVTLMGSPHSRNKKLQEPNRDINLYHCVLVGLLSCIVIFMISFTFAERRNCPSLGAYKTEPCSLGNRCTRLVGPANISIAYIVKGVVYIPMHESTCSVYKDVGNGGRRCIGGVAFVTEDQLIAGNTDDVVYITKWTEVRDDIYSGPMVAYQVKSLGIMGPVVKFEPDRLGVMLRIDSPFPYKFKKGAYFEGVLSAREIITL